MDVVRGEKSFDVKSLQLTMESLAIADRRYSKLHFPEWLDLKKLPTMISKPTALKSHDWKQVLSHKMKVLRVGSRRQRILMFYTSFKSS